jgi:hypothetical protein
MSSARRCSPLKLLRVVIANAASMIPHLVHAIFGPNDGTVRSPGRWSTFTISRSRRH